MIILFIPRLAFRLGSYKHPAILHKCHYCSYLLEGRRICVRAQTVAFSGGGAHSYSAWIQAQHRWHKMNSGMPFLDPSCRLFQDMLSVGKFNIYICL